MFSATQKKIISAAVVFTSLIFIGACLFVTIRTLGVLLNHFAAVIWPLLIATLLAFIIQPVVDFFHLKLKMSPLMSIILIYGIAAIFFFCIVSYLLPTLIFETLSLLKSLPEFIQNLVHSFKMKSPEWMSSLKQYLSDEQIAKVSNLVVEYSKEYSGALLLKIKGMFEHIFSGFSLLAGLALVPIYLFFLVQITLRQNKKSLEKHLSFMRSYADDTAFLIRQFTEIVVSFYRGQILIAGVLGIFYAISFIILGIPFGLILGLFVGFLNVIPNLGTIIGLGIALPTAYFQAAGGVTNLLFIFLVFVLAQLFEGLVLTPKIMGKRIGLHPMVLMLSIFFWGTALDGLMGVLIGIPLTAFLITFWKWLRLRYLD